MDDAYTNQFLDEVAFEVSGSRAGLDACRESTESIQLFEDMLSDLRADIPLSGPSTGAGH